MTAPVPDDTEQWIDAIYQAVLSDALACGWFERVNGAEPRSTPGHGLTCALWIQSGPDPLPRASGLDVTSAVLVFNVRVYTSSTAEPRDEIDPNAAKAVSALVRRWHDNYDFDLHPLVRNVDLLGHSGTRLGSVAGYVPMGGSGAGQSVQLRVMTITLPIICNDIWPIGGGS